MNDAICTLDQRDSQRLAHTWPGVGHKWKLVLGWKSGASSSVSLRKWAPAPGLGALLLLLLLLFPESLRTRWRASGPPPEVREATPGWQNSQALCSAPALSRSCVPLWPFHASHPNPTGPSLYQDPPLPRCIGGTRWDQAGPGGFSSCLMVSPPLGRGGWEGPLCPFVTSYIQLGGLSVVGERKLAVSLTANTQTDWNN